MKRFLSAVLCLALCSVALGFTCSPQTLNPADAVNDNSFGTRAWLGLPGNVQADDGSGACPSSGISYNQSMQFCKSTFAFSVDPCATNVSVTFRVKRKKTGTSNIQDAAARLVLGGSIQTDDFSQGINWPTTYTFAEYTFSGLTAEQVNDTGFGFAISAKNVTPNSGEPKTGTPFIEVIEAVATW